MSRKEGEACICGAELPWHLIELGGLQVGNSAEWTPGGVEHHCSCGRVWKDVSQAEDNLEVELDDE